MEETRERSQKTQELEKAGDLKTERETERDTDGDSERRRKGADKKLEGRQPLASRKGQHVAQLSG